MCKLDRVFIKIIFISCISKCVGIPLKFSETEIFYRKKMAQQCLVCVESWQIEINND